MPEDQRLGVGGGRSFRTWQGDGTGHVVQEVVTVGEALEIQREMLTELRAIRRGLEMFLGLELSENAA